MVSPNPMDPCQPRCWGEGGKGGAINLRSVKIMSPSR